MSDKMFTDPQGQIEPSGYFRVSRRGVMKDVFCPHQECIEARCGDWCALFGEPYAEKDENGDVEVHIPVCNNSEWTFLLGNFEDRRVRGK